MVTISYSTFGTVYTCRVKAERAQEELAWLKSFGYVIWARITG